MSRRARIDDLRDRQAVMSVDRACDEFEAAWQAGGRPRIEDYLAAGSTRAVMLAELIPIEVEYRRRRECPRPDEYAARFPELDSGSLCHLIGIDTGPPPPTPTGPPQTNGRFRLLRQAGQGACAVLRRPSRAAGRRRRPEDPYPAAEAARRLADQLR